MPKTVYFDQSDKPRLVQSYCVFVDFLGFNQQIRDAAERGEEDVIFRRFMNEIEPIIRDTVVPTVMDEIEGFPRTWDAKVFTDNVVLGYGLWSERGEKEFGSAITTLLEFQYRNALKGFFVRGGWSLGSLFMNQNTVFGTALLDAYHLETKVAKSPRIVLSDTMKDAVFRHMVRYKEDPPQRYYLLADKDGMLFTNYLYESIVDGEVQWDELRCHAGVIRGQLAKFAKCAKCEEILAKYEWLAGYHNFFCDLVSKGLGYSDDVRVPGSFSNYGIRELVHDESPYVVQAKQEAVERARKLDEIRRQNLGEE